MLTHLRFLLPEPEPPSILEQPRVPKTNAIILAGGTSSRMGQPKAWLPVGGVPALCHVLEQVLPVCEQVIVVAAPGQALPDLPSNVRRVDDPPSRRGEGPLGGIATGLEALEAPEGPEDGPEAVAYIGTSDAIFTLPEHVLQLFGELRDRPEVSAVVPVSQEGGRRILHGLAAAVRAKPARKAAMELLERGERSVRSLYANLPILELPVRELTVPNVTLACNTPAQWAEALTRLFERTR